MRNIARKKITREYYSKRARDYDQQKIRTWQSEYGFGAEVLGEVTDALTTFEEERILEVGVGSGRIGFPLLKKVKPWYVGLDLSKEMLGLARTKMSFYKQIFDLILADAEYFPFVDCAFHVIFCISTMHYFADSDRSLREFSRVLKENGVFVYGDLVMHEMDTRGFLDELEKTLSQAHVRYFKPSEMKTILENHGFRVSRMRIIPYRKSYQSLMEDKGKYFDVKPEALNKCMRRATVNERKLYSIGGDELTLFYTIITALKENKC